MVLKKREADEAAAKVCISPFILLRSLWCTRSLEC